jgi:hypothetical protein
MQPLTAAREMRRRATETKTVGNLLHDPFAKRTMLVIAAAYELLARHHDRKKTKS